MPLRSYHSRKLSAPAGCGFLPAPPPFGASQSSTRHHRSILMQLLSYAYRFLSNFVFLALVYLALNFLEKYQHRVVVAILVLGGTLLWKRTRFS